MATLTPAGQHIATPHVPDVKGELTVPLIPQMGATQPKNQSEQRPSSAAKKQAKTVALQVGVPIVVTSALLLAGLMRPQIERGLRHLVEKAADISIPVLLPVAIAETVREMIAGRRAFAETTAEPDAVN